MPLAASMGEPPPTATTTGRPDAGSAAADARRAPAARSSVVGFGCTPLNTVTGSPAAASSPVTVPTTGVAASAASVTSSTELPPAAATISGSLATAPEPK